MIVKSGHGNLTIENARSRRKNLLTGKMERLTGTYRGPDRMGWGPKDIVLTDGQDYHFNESDIIK
ncbi:MAG TPA: hypothetical protein VMW10_06685 [Alphaproteobacteria bacterium]|nr:hypothetical protein [Alphaproteobacteria bacterium]